MRARIDRIEAAIHQDVGRGMDAVFAATRGGLWDAVTGLAAASSVGLITGFFIPGADPPAAETDGPAGAALLARGLTGAGLRCRLATDPWCANACRVALETAGAANVAVDTGPIEDLIALWRQDGIDWVIAIERCGPAADGSLRNMRGRDIAAYATPLDRLFSAGPWRTMGIGDGGNELGMGSVPRAVIAAHVPNGTAIGCIVPADALVTAGVSHWGAYAVLAGLALLRPDWAPALTAALDPTLDLAVIDAMIRDGPAVDGVTLRREMTVDGIGMPSHHVVLAAITA